jgi:hypothetical protein
MDASPDTQDRRDKWIVVALRPIGEVDLTPRPKGEFGFARFILHRGAEADMREFFDKMVLSGCPMVEMMAVRQGVVQRHDCLVEIVADRTDLAALDPETLQRLGEAILEPRLQRDR